MVFKDENDSAFNFGEFLFINGGVLYGVRNEKRPPDEQCCCVPKSRSALLLMRVLRFFVETFIRFESNCFEIFRSGVTVC